MIWAPIQAAILIAAGLLWATMPEWTPPPILWRLHFGGAMYAFGMTGGLALAIILVRKDGQG